MPIDLRSELQRPIAIALAGVALVGWLLFLIVLVNLSQENRQARDQVVQLQSSETRLRSELGTRPFPDCSRCPRDRERAAGP